jgi:hypothetical protein
LRRTDVCAFNKALEVITTKYGLKLCNPSQVVRTFQLKSWEKLGMLEKVEMISVGGLEEEEADELELAIERVLPLDLL